MAVTPLPRTAAAARSVPIGLGDTTVAGHRRGGGRKRGRLRSVRAQLLAPIVVATIGLAVLGTVQSTTATSAAQDASRAQVFATTATGTVRLIHEVERELAETVALRQRGGKAGLQLVTAQRERTDAAADRYRQVSRAALRNSSSLGNILRAAENALDALPAARSTALTGTTPSNAAADRVYLTLSTALIAVADALPAKVFDLTLSNEARTVAAVAAMEHFDGLERTLVRGVYARGSLESGELVELATIDGQRQQRLAEFRRIADPFARGVYDSLVQGKDVENAAQMRDNMLGGDGEASSIKGDPDAWYTAQSGSIRRTYLVALRLSNHIDAEAASIARTAQQRAWITAGGAAGIALLALFTAIVLAVRTSRRLRRLRRAALTVARRELPDAVLSVTTGMAPPTDEPGPSAAAITRSIAAGSDEIGEVADAFATVHRTALRLAAQQAELRVDVARMAEILARRIRTLITRQLRLLDEFEREEIDPDALARLFALDHLAARLRRNGENLLVMAGGEPGRPFTQAFPLAAVVTAAASEIEDFHRVEAAVGDILIAGGVVGDLVHLLAELLENAATFSPPHTPVRVDARRTVDGAIVRVHDTGIGIVAAKLAEINSRLVQPATLTSAAAGTMGLHVVAHLAARHGIKVQLHPTGTGTVAYVALPHQCLASQAALPAGSRGGAEASVIPGRPPMVATLGEYSLSRAGGGAAIDPGNQAAWFRPYLRGNDSQTAPVRPGSSPEMWATTAATLPPNGQSTGWTPAPTPPRPGYPPAQREAPDDMPGMGGSSGPPSVWPPMPVPISSPPSQDYRSVSAMATPTSAIPVQGGMSAAYEMSSTQPMTGDGGLPRRNPGAQLAPGAAAPAPPPPATAAPVDPEQVRARLSAFAEGVSAALRRSYSPTQATKDR